MEKRVELRIECGKCHTKKIFQIIKEKIINDIMNQNLVLFHAEKNDMIRFEGIVYQLIIS